MHFATQSVSTILQVLVTFRHSKTQVYSFTSQQTQNTPTSQNPKVRKHSTKAQTPLTTFSGTQQLKTCQTDIQTTNKRRYNLSRNADTPKPNSTCWVDTDKADSGEGNSVVVAHFGIHHPDGHQKAAGMVVAVEVVDSRND